MISRLISLSSLQELHKLALLYPQPYFLCLLNTHSQMYQWPTVPFLPISYIQEALSSSCHGFQHLPSSKVQFKSQPISGVPPGYKKSQLIQCGL